MFGILKNIFGSREKTNLKSLLQNGAVIIDVRTPQEFKGGHVKGAVNMPLDSLNVSKVKQYNKPIILCCASGRRSSAATQQLLKVGIEAYNGGSWTSVERLLD